MRDLIKNYFVAQIPGEIYSLTKNEARSVQLSTLASEVGTGIIALFGTLTIAGNNERLDNLIYGGVTILAATLSRAVTKYAWDNYLRGDKDDYLRGDNDSGGSGPEPEPIAPSEGERLTEYYWKSRERNQRSLEKIR